jgi:shikimate 5-dehydrogenase
MPRLPRKPSAPRPYGAGGAAAAALARRRDARAPRVTVRDRAGRVSTLDPADPAAERLLEAAAELLAAADSPED